MRGPQAAQRHTPFNPEETTMTTRREFLKSTAGAAGIAFTSCAMLDAAHAQQKPISKRREISIGGRRIKTIDIHAHCAIPEAMALHGDKFNGQTRGQAQQVIVIEERLSSMNEQGIDMEALSINPTWYKLERDLADKVVQLQNEKLAELCGKYPDRFVAFASLALQHPDLAVQQLETAVKKYNLRGAAVGASCNGEEFSDAKFHPVWAKAEELGVVVFIHPQSTPELAKRFRGNGWLSNTIGNPLDTTIALSHIIYEGVLDKYPGLKVASAHGGGYLPSYAPRSDHACMVSPSNCNPNIKLKKKPTEYLNQMYFDSLVFTSEALRHLIAQVGVSQLVLGTDHPIPWAEDAVNHVLNTPGLTDDQKISILQGTAAKLLNIKV
jgi:aminocarboxymuconate-semialdehyde decarboxylase